MVGAQTTEGAKSRFWRGQNSQRLKPSPFKTMAFGANFLGTSGKDLHTSNRHTET
jgi:hypothetical protein